MSTRLKIALFLLVLVLPGVLMATTAAVSFQRAQSLEFCSSCHTMTPWVDNMTGKESDSLASEHYKNRWIQTQQCYTCHTNYGFLGPLEAKIKGMRHLIAYYVGEDAKIELYDEFPNENCLHCHQDAKGFLEDSNHDPIEDILSGEDRCIDCHENLHGIEQPGYDDEEEAAEGDDEAQEGEADEAEPAAGAASGEGAE
jgi:cytochrome c nitrite reductase small subunit